MLPSLNDIVQIFLFLSVLTAFTPILGMYYSRVMNGEVTERHPALGRIERRLCSLCGIEMSKSMNAGEYTFAVLLFNAAGFVLLFILLLCQSALPLNPQHLSNPSWHLALNIAVSFVTNTNWQSYAGETTLSYFVQMAGLTVQNFASASTGIAVMFALARGIRHKGKETVGNFWVDLVRSTVCILLPLSLLLGILLVGEGAVQTLSPYQRITTIEGSVQTIPVGPAASQVAIKQLGTNGGGFFNANSAHPFENPTPFSNFCELIAILLVPSSLVFSYGKEVGSQKHGWTLWGVMMVLFVAFLCISLYSEYVYGTMEGKEVRFGMTGSVTWSVATTAASNGSVNALHDSLSPLSGLIAMLNMMLGEIIFGGAGAGMYGMIVFVVLTVFIAGLMVGRTPEYLGKKIESREITLTALAVLLPSAVILVFTAVAVMTNAGVSGIGNSGPHGFSEILYAYTSAGANNGSAFAGLNTNTAFYNITLAVGMLIGRFGVIIPMLLVAGNLSRKNSIPASAGTFRTDTLLFALLLIAVIFIVGALTFFPALTLGPILEHLMM